MIYTILEKSRKEKKVIILNLYAETGYYAGIVLDYTNEIIQLQHFDQYGRPDGVVLEKISHIERFDFDDPSTHSLEYIIKNQHLLEEAKFKNRFYEELTEENWQLQSLRVYVKDKTQIISLQINHNDFFKGFIEEMDDEVFLFRIIDDFGEDKGLSAIRISEVNSIKVNDSECRKRKLLFDWKNGGK